MMKTLFKDADGAIEEAEFRANHERRVMIVAAHNYGYAVQPQRKN